MSCLHKTLVLILLAGSTEATRAGFVSGRPAPPPVPPVLPRIAERYTGDADGNAIQDRLQSRIARAFERLRKAGTGFDVYAVQTQLLEATPVELIFTRPVTQEQIDRFLNQGGIIEYMYTHVSYGWQGRLPLGNVAALPPLLGGSLVQVEQPVPVVMHLDRATQSGRVRPVWASGFAGSGGLDGDGTITIGIVDSGLDDTHPDFPGGAVYWEDFTTDSEPDPIDIDQHGTHVSGIALGSGTAGGATTGTIEFTDVGDLTDVGGFYASPVDRLSGSFTADITALWLGGDSTTLHLVYHAKPSGGWYSGGSVSGSSPLTLNTSRSASTANAYSPALIGTGGSGVTDYAVTCRFSNYPAIGDGFPTFQGVAPGCNLAAAKVFTASGAGFSTWTGQAIDALVANRVALNIKVINLSLGASGDPGISSSNRQKVNTAVANGIVVCASAGNDGRKSTAGAREVDDPGRAAMALTIGAMNDVNELTEYSSHGFSDPVSTSGKEEDYKPDIVAPGGSQSRYTAIMAPDSNSGDGEAFADQQADDYIGLQGTSMASPFAAGAAALVIDALQQSGVTWDFYSDADARFVKMLLCATATELNANREDGNYNPTLQRAAAGPDGYPSGKDPYEGYGALNPDAAIEAVLLSYAPGGSVSETFGSNPEDRRAWARAVHLQTGTAFDPALDVPAAGDFDLYLYDAAPAVYGTPVLLASSTAAGAGVDESLSYTSGSDRDAVLVVKRVSGSGTFSLTSTAVGTKTLTVASVYGMADPSVGEHTYDAGTSLTCAITNSPVMIYEATRQSLVVCTGWVGTGSAPVSGTTANTGPFTLNTDSSVTWMWAVSNLWLSNQVVEAEQSEEALGRITARDGYTVGTNGSVTFRAGEEIRLEDGFKARSGSEFNARTF